MTNPTHDGEYLVATCSEYGYLLWSVADCYPDEGLFIATEGYDIPFADCYKWYKLPDRKEELNANPQIPCIRPDGQ